MKCVGRSGSEYDWDPCSFYDLDYTSIIQHSNDSFEIASGIAEEMRSEPSVAISTCSHWDWDLSIYHSTTVSQVSQSYI